MSQRVLIMGGIVWRFAFLLGVFKAIKTGGITWRFWVVLGGISCFVLCGIVWRLPVLTAHYMRIKNGWYCMAFREVLRVYIRVVLGGGWLSDHSRKTKEKQRRNKEEIKKE